MGSSHTWHTGPLACVPGIRSPSRAVRNAGPAREVKLLSDYRRELVRQRTRVQNRLRWHLHELDPALQVPSRGLRRYQVIDEVAARLQGVDLVVARLALQLLVRCRRLTAEINLLEAELRALVKDLAPSLLAIRAVGCSAPPSLSARPPVCTGSAPAPPTPASPGPRRSRSGPVTAAARSGLNRAINCALHMIAVTQARGIGPGKDYLAKAQARGKTQAEARPRPRQSGCYAASSPTPSSPLSALTNGPLPPAAQPNATSTLPSSERLDIGASRNSTARSGPRELHPRAQEGICTAPLGT